MFVILQMLCWNKQTNLNWKVSHHAFFFEGTELSKQQSNHWPTEAAAIGTNKKLSIKRIPSTVTKIRPEPISAERADNAKRYGGRENNRTVEISWYEVTERANIFVPPSPPHCMHLRKSTPTTPTTPTTPMSRNVQYPFKQLLGVLHMSPFSTDPRCPICFKSWSTAQKTATTTNQLFFLAGCERFAGVKVPSVELDRFANDCSV